MSPVHRLDFGFAPKLPVILQTEAAECGLACLAMVASHFGRVVDLPFLRRRFCLSLKGATLAHIMEFGSGLQLASRALRLELEDLPKLRAPCILHWDLNHFVVLKEAGRSRVVVHDPAFGVRSLTYAEVSRHFTGVALELNPTQEFRRGEDRRAVSVRELMGRVVGIERSLAQLLLLALALEVFGLVSPYFMQLVMDGVVVSADRDLLVVLAIGFALLIGLQVAVTLLRSWVVMYLATTLNLQWTANVFAHLLRLPVAYFEKRHIGDVVSRFGAIGTIQQTVTTSFVEAILDGLMALVTCAMMFYYSPALCAISLVATFVYATVRALAYGPLRAANEEQIVLGAKQQSTLLETIRGVQSLKLFAREDERQARWLNQVAETTNRGLRVQRLMAVYRAANALVFGAENIAVVYFGTMLVLDNLFSVGMLFAYTAYKGNFTARVSSLIDKFFELRMLRVQAERLADIVMHEREAETPPVTAAMAQPAPSIEVRHLAFRYADSEPPVLKDCSFLVEAGECVAIVGPSGGGKTTLVKLLLGLFEPQEGEILVGGTSIRQLGLRRYRQMVGTVMQDDQLFAGSIADNISFFDAQPDAERIEQCARLAAVHDDVVRMPMGYNTLIGDMGTAISGGQKQRVLLARALYKQPRILLLDEATSHLDVANERAVNLAMKRLDMTRIVVAHRPETIAMADRVIVLSNGGVSSDLRRVPAAMKPEGVQA